MPFDFGNANSSQKQAIITTEGPLLIIAGPGTGKTATLVKRTQYLIEEKRVSPEQILVVTFTEKAAKELITRISNALLKSNVNADLTKMQIGTFHSVFGKILADHIEYTQLNRNYVQLDDYMQKELISKNLNKFKELPHYHALDKIKWKYDNGYDLPVRRIIGNIVGMVNRYREELVPVEEMKQNEDPIVIAVAEILELYQQLLIDNNMLDFSGILVEMYRLITQFPQIQEELSGKYRYLMVDEYQDTNYVQEQTMIKLAGETKNLCVVGDDDQSLYRFRGATISNILGFTDLFPGKNQDPIKLEINYRSSPDIIRFYNKWMDDKNPGGGAKANAFLWKKARLAKDIRNAPGVSDPGTSVVRLSANGKDNWHESVYRMISGLKDEGKITDYNQVVCLTAAARDCGMLINYLENKNVPVYAPRFGMFFQRKEIKELIGCLLLTYPAFMTAVHAGAEKLPLGLDEYYEKCEESAKEISADNPLGKWITQKSFELASLKEDAHYGLSDMVYQLLSFKPFSDYVTLDNDGTYEGGVMRERAARNIAHFLDMVSYFETTNYMTDGFAPDNYRDKINRFFRYYINDRMNDRTEEYEDDSEYAPSGCVSFMTIHQSKGMEFPVVIVILTDRAPNGGGDPLTEGYIRPFMRSRQIEDKKNIGNYDFWRLYYTAFSRAKNLLVLTIDEDKIEGKKVRDFQFAGLYRSLPEYNDVSLDRIEFSEIEDVNLKPVYSFTSHLGVYDTCPRQYYFFKKLGFAPCHTGNTLFGTLVHETIEDINKAAIAGRTSEINDENIENWLNSNYRTLMMAEHYHLSRADKANALEQVKNYVDYVSDDWSQIKETEVEVTDVHEEYILLGKVDLIRGEGDTYELVDFKTGEKPKPNDRSTLLKHYKQQLMTYSHLVMQRTGKKISKAHLYYTREKTDPLITVTVTKRGVNDTLESFEDIIQRIKNNDFRGYACEKKTCSNCDLRYYCKNDSGSPVHENIER